MAKIYDHSLCFSQAHGSVELSSFCEGYFLQQMPALMEREGFRSLLLGPPGARQGNSSTSTLVHSRGDSPLEELEATLARRLRSLYVTSRVWGQQDSCRGEKTEISGRMWQMKQKFHLITDTGFDSSSISVCGQFNVSYFVPIAPSWHLLLYTACLWRRKFDNVMLFTRLGKL